MSFTLSFTGEVREHSLQGNEKVGFELSSLAVGGPGQMDVFVREAGLGLEAQGLSSRGMGSKQAWTLFACL